MAGQQRAASTASVTRGKLALIAALGVVFALVVYWNYFRDDAAAEDAVATAGPATAPAATAKRRAAPRPTAAEDAADSEESLTSINTEPWPEFDLAKVTSRDPFALPAKFPQPPPPVAIAADPQPTPEELEAIRLKAKAQEHAATLAEIKRAGVELVLRDGQKYIAKIGELEVGVGDKIGDFIVVDISLQGVTLELEGESP